MRGGKGGSRAASAVQTGDGLGCLLDRRSSLDLHGGRDEGAVVEVGEDHREALDLLTARDEAVRLVDDALELSPERRVVDLVQPRTGVRFVYGLVSASAALIVMLLLRPYARRSALALAEFVSWRAGMVLSLVAAAGGGVGILLAPTAWAKIVPFLDPVLVLLACATVVPMALGLVRQGMRELLGAAPPPDLHTAIDAAISDGVSHVGLGDDLPRPIVRASKLGRRLLVEVDFVVSEHAWSVDEEDVLRRAITDRLDALAYQTWATIELTTDPALAAD